ncbi:MAG: DinB family protein [Anaerolineae bacterium]|nr:DinB family protein [Anaerolineae bacterium]
MPKLKITPTEIANYTTMLDSTPRQLASLTADLNDAQLQYAASEKDWSLTQILAHLRSCDALWTYSIYAMLAHATPTLPLLDERTWAKTTRYADSPFHASLQSFTLARTELINVLRQLPEPAWSRSAVIEGRTHTVFSQARRMALHESEHLSQVASFLAALPSNAS